MTTMNEVECFAFRYHDSGIDVESCDDSVETVRDRVLQTSLGWRYGHPDRYSHDDEWRRLLEYGEIVRVTVRTQETKTDDSN